MTTLSLSCDNFVGNMTEGLLSMLETEQLANVTIAVEGNYLKAHQMVLSICSPYFSTLLQDNPCKHPIIFMKGVRYTIMKHLLRFMYEGQTHLETEEFPFFIETAQELQIKWLTDSSNEQLTRPPQPIPPPVAKCEETNKQTERKSKVPAPPKFRFQHVHTKYTSDLPKKRGRGRPKGSPNKRPRRPFKFHNKHLVVNHQPVVLQESEESTSREQEQLTELPGHNLAEMVVECDPPLCRDEVKQEVEDISCDDNVDKFLEITNQKVALGNEPDEHSMPQPIKRGRGRPKGSTKKAKIVSAHVYPGSWEEQEEPVDEKIEDANITEIPGEL